MKKVILYCIFLLLIISCNDLVQWQKETTNFTSQQSIFEIQLLPGMKSSGWIYYWTEGSLSGKVKEEPDMGWLDIINPDISSSSCSIDGVEYSFLAPMTTGLYTAKVTETSGNFYTTQFNMEVTENPSKNVFNRTATLNPGDTFIHAEDFYWNGINTTGWGDCVPKPYYPSSTQWVVSGTTASANVIKVEPSSFVQVRSQLNEVKTKIIYDKKGTYVYYVYFSYQWLRNPIYFKWTITMQ